MLDPAKIEALRQAAEANNWAAVGEVFIEVGDDQAALERLAPAVRLRDAEGVGGGG